MQKELMVEAQPKQDAGNAGGQRNGKGFMYFAISSGHHVPRFTAGVQVSLTYH